LGITVASRRLDLGEVGVHRHVEGHVRGDAPAHGDPGLGIFVGGLEGLVECGARLGAAGGHRGHHLQVVARVHPGEPGDGVELADEAVEALVVVGRAQLVDDRARVVPHGEEAPGLLVGGPGEAELLEGDGHLHPVAVVGDAAGGGPDRVPGVVLRVVDVAHHRIELHAEGVDPEVEGPAPVAERVDEEADRVVVEGGVPVGEIGADACRLRVVGAEGDVETLVVEGDQRLGLDRRGGVVPGQPLVGDRDRRGALPGRLVEHAVHHDGPRGRRHADLLPARPALAFGRLGTRRAERDGQRRQEGDAGLGRATTSNGSSTSGNWKQERSLSTP
jgi:hypothetical protein